MIALVAIVAVVVILPIIAASMARRIVTQYERGVAFRFGRVVAVKKRGLALTIPVAGRPRKAAEAARS